MSEPPEHSFPQVWPSAPPQSQPQMLPPAWPQRPPQSDSWPPPGQPVPGSPSGVGDQKFADRSRKNRTWIGVLSIIVGGFDLIGTGLIAALLAGNPHNPAFGDFGGGLVVFGAVQGLAYVGIGIWTLARRRSTERAPIVSILVLTSMGILLGILDVVDGIASGKMPQLGSYVLVVVLFQRAITVLRLKPFQNPYASS